MRRFLNEQYLLQMLLTSAGDEWRVEYAGFLLQLKYPRRMARAFKHFGAVPHRTGSPEEVTWQAAAFWMTRVRVPSAAPLDEQLLEEEDE